ncbi:exodeoxyribonuclease III [Kiloniella sp. b19]|uniref:exodeoxyribonuclease III n=1 Tax=Kiloniella sp. GXU_MW_B19 TaxID=3141326 RepID=UPI0031E091CB
MAFRVATWNVNSIRQRLDHLKSFVDTHQPDVLCLQETKVRDEEFPKDDMHAMGFETVLFHGQKSYNGVAVLVRKSVQAEERLVWCDKDDRRHLAVTLENGLTVHNFYVPSGGGVPDAEANDKFAHKLQFLDEMAQWVAQPEQKAGKLLLVGDMNVAPFENDVWNHKRLQKQIGHTPGECERLVRLHTEGDLIDVGRHFVPEDQTLFSWWGYRYKLSVEKDYGWRLDHILASQSLEGNLRSFKAVKDTRLWEKPSDHIPLVVELDL